MLIGGIQKTTLVDYPHHIATIVFTAWCNLRCRFCHNPELVVPAHIQASTLIPEDVFFAFLDERTHLLDGVVISGGEPTLQADLPTFCRRIQERWLLVKLDTNGRDPHLIKDLARAGLVDYIAMDMKIDDLHWLELLQSKERLHPYHASISYLLQGNIPYEFRTTLIKPYHTLSVFTRMLHLITGADQYFLQTYRPHHTLDPTFDGQAFTLDEMRWFQSIANQYVTTCHIR